MPVYIPLSCSVELFFGTGKSFLMSTQDMLSKIGKKIKLIGFKGDYLYNGVLYDSNIIYELAILIWFEDGFIREEEFVYFKCTHFFNPFW